MDFKELNEQLQPYINKQSTQIAEGGLSRILTYFKSDDLTCAIISAYRNENSDQCNKRNTMLLTNDLIEMGLGFVKMEGGYIETNEQGQLIPCRERSLFIANITKEQALQLCNKYNQESILFKDKDGLRYVNKQGKDDSPKFNDIIVDNDFVLTKIKQYFSRRLQGHNQRNYFQLKETDNLYIGIQNWNWGRSSVTQFNDCETSDYYINIDKLQGYKNEL